jgi:hypothetical protein
MNTFASVCWYSHTHSLSLPMPIPRKHAPYTLFADARTALRPHATPLRKARLFVTSTPLCYTHTPASESPHLTLALPMPAPLYCHTRSCRNHLSLLCAHCYNTRPLPESTPLVINTQSRTRLLAYAHSLCRHSHRYLPHPLVVPGRKHASLLQANRFAIDVQPLPNALCRFVPTALLPHTIPLLKAPPCYKQTHAPICWHTHTHFGDARTAVQ